MPGAILRRLQWRNAETQTMQWDSGWNKEITLLLSGLFDSSGTGVNTDQAPSYQAMLTCNVLIWNWSMDFARHNRFIFLYNSESTRLYRIGI